MQHVDICLQWHNILDNARSLMFIDNISETYSPSSQVQSYCLKLLARSRCSFALAAAELDSCLWAPSKGSVSDGNGPDALALLVACAARSWIFWCCLTNLTKTRRLSSPAKGTSFYHESAFFIHRHTSASQTSCRYVFNLFSLQSPGSLLPFPTSGSSGSENIVTALAIAMKPKNPYKNVRAGILVTLSNFVMRLSPSVRCIDTSRSAWSWGYRMCYKLFRDEYSCLLCGPRTWKLSPSLSLSLSLCDAKRWLKVGSVKHL